MYLPNLSAMSRMRFKFNFARSISVLKSEFSFSNVKQSSLINNLPITVERIVGFILFPSYVKCQNPRWVTESMFYDDNHYAKCASLTVPIIYIIQMLSSIFAILLGSSCYIFVLRNHIHKIILILNTNKNKLMNTKNSRGFVVFVLFFKNLLEILHLFFS